MESYINLTYTFMKLQLAVLSALLLAGTHTSIIPLDTQAPKHKLV